MKQVKNKINRNVLVIAGPTGSGETTLTLKIIEKYPIFQRLVTATTRKPRGKDKNGVAYYFFSKKRFENEIKKGNIIEYTYVKNRDVYYGSYKKDLDKKLKAGLNIIVNPDIVGTKYYKKKYRATTIFLMPDSIKNLISRLTKRQPDISKEELKRRLKNAKNEIKNEKEFYDFVVVNKEGKIEETANKIIDILKKEGYAFN
jgi:guanylate kinase